MGGLYLSIESLLKIGKLIINKGKYNNKQLINLNGLINQSKIINQKVNIGVLIMVMVIIFGYLKMLFFVGVLKDNIYLFYLKKILLQLFFNGIIIMKYFL